MSSVEKNLKTVRTFKYSLLGEGIFVGVLTGLVVGSFRWVLGQAGGIKDYLLGFTQKGLVGGLILAAVLVVVAIAVAALINLEPEIGGSGIPQVEGELKGHVDMKWYRVLPAKFVGCALAIGSGLALGREGPSIQLGAMVGKGFARITKMKVLEERILLTCGAGAGLSAAFGAPLAGAIFALEELHQTFGALVLITTMAAAAVSDFVAIQIFGVDPVFQLADVKDIPPELYWTLPVLGIVLGVLAYVYNNVIDGMQNAFQGVGTMLSNPKHRSYVKMLVIMALCFSMYYIYPTALGSGSNLVGEISTGQMGLYALMILIGIKFLYSTGCFGSGSPGGIFLPLLVLGAVAGGLGSRILTASMGIGEEYISFFVIMGMAGLFAGIVRAPATGIILITEMTGEFSSFLALVIVSLTSYLVAERMGAEPIYEQLWNRRIRGQQTMKEAKVSKLKATRKAIIYQDIHIGSYIEGRMVKDLGFPRGALIVAVIRESEEFIPAGDTILKQGDKLEILCREAELADIKALLVKRCQKLVGPEE